MSLKEKNAKVKWGIIGCGNVTEVKSGPGLQKAQHSELVAVMRRTAYLAEDYARRHGVKKWYSDAEALINDPEVTAVYIATPPASHKYYTLMVAAAGKSVYVEKPMARNFQECQEMIEACKVAGVALFVAYYRRALAKFIKIRDLLEQGAIGTVCSLSIRLHVPPRNHSGQPGQEGWRVNPDIAGGGYFVDLASHMFDFLDYALGPIERVQGFASNQAGYYRAEDMVSANFVFISGVHGVGTWCFNSFERQDITEIVGTKGRLSFVTFDDSPISLSNSGGLSSYSLPYPEHVQQPLIQTVVDELRGTGKCPSTAESAARSNWVMDKILADYYQ